METIKSVSIFLNQVYSDKRNNTILKKINIIRSYFEKHQLDVKFNKISSLGIVIATDKSDPIDIYVMYCKGLIFCTKTGNIKGVSPPIPIKVDKMTPREINYIDIKKVTLAYDGMNFKMYYHNDRWNFSTYNNIFVNVLEKEIKSMLLNYDNFDKDLCYNLIIQGPKFNNIIEHCENSLILVSTINTKTLSIIDDVINSDLNKMEEIVLTEPLSNYVNKLNNIIEITDNVGIYVIDKYNNRYRFETKYFKSRNLFKHRGIKI